MWTRFSKRIALSPRAVNDRWASKNLREQNIARFSSGREHDFYKVTTLGASNGDAKYVQGEIIDQSVDLRAARPGDVIDVPYEVTVNSSLRDFWQSAFYSYDRINTSTPFARSLGLPDQVLPFNLMLFLAGSMSHADQARLQIGFRNAVYHWPGFSGDTFQKRFIIRKLRTTSKKENSVFTIHCQLKNQHDQVVFSCEKTMLYPFKIPPSAEEVPEVEEAQDGAFLDYIVRHAHILQAKGSQTLSPLRPGQLILHTLSRPLTLTHTMQLASLARLTHERHFDTRKYAHEELLVPGGLVLGLTTSLAARDLHESLYEELVQCTFPNNLSPGDTVGAVTFVQALEEHVGGDIEALCIRTIGIKNCDVLGVLAHKDLPVELFAGSLKGLRPSAVEAVVAKECPELSRQIVCVADRKVYRQAPVQPPFLL